MCVMLSLILPPLALVCGLQAQTIPFVLPWNDATASSTDFSNLNAPISTNRVAADTNGHFVVNGERIRFLGVNFAGDSPFMPTNNAEAVAARLAKSGVTMCRMRIVVSHIKADGYSSRWNSIGGRPSTRSFGAASRSVLRCNRGVHPKAA